MRVGVIFVAIASGLGCVDDGESGENGMDCDVSFYGYDCPSEDAQMALDRINELRGIMGVEGTVLESRLDEASQSHAEYMLMHGLSHSEDANSAGFTGEQVWDRMEAFGYPLEAGNLWSEVVSMGYDPVGAIDGWVGSVYHRIPFTSPQLVEVGFGQDGVYSSMATVAPYPIPVHDAVLYPADGQVDVPTTFDSDTEWPDPAPQHGVVGYPISVSVGTSATTSSSNNPYDVTVIEAEVTGPDGVLDVLTLQPAYDDGMYNMVALLPTTPLTASTTYDVYIVLSWGGQEDIISGSFQTAP